MTHSSDSAPKHKRKMAHGTSNDADGALLPCRAPNIIRKVIEGQNKLEQFNCKSHMTLS